MTALDTRPEATGTGTGHRELVHGICGCANPPDRDEDITLCALRSPRDGDIAGADDLPDLDECIVCVHLAPGHHGHLPALP